MMGLGAGLRFRAVEAVISRTARKIAVPTDEDGRPLNVSEFFGINTFDLKKMKEKLPKDVYSKLLLTVEHGKKLDLEIANVVAHSVKEWALSQGVTHFCHWFQPQTGSTAEKHDAFLSIDETRRPFESFSASQLIQSEPDASSFPSGGRRTTFEARGYTGWDPSSPLFIMEATNGKTLCIPSVFISYHGEALDEKTLLIRSMEALSVSACAMLHQIGDTSIKRIVATLGAEQEYFLIDRAFALLRPDLLMSGRSLLGAQPAKGQQLEDHYFGSIPARVQAFMSEVEYELFKLGVPMKTRHNEVAPSQYEMAPIFEEANIASDHNQLVMAVIQKVARKHDFLSLIHEKPFAGVNGSGKHCNWSMQVATSGSGLDGYNLLDPGKTPHQNVRFLVCLAAVLRGVHKHQGLLRAAIASSGNDHRLGANEAPPAIISVFLGDMLNRILDEIEKGAVKGVDEEEAVIKLGIAKLPEIMRDNTDRNRTSPFAFTGNKFEFRAVGASASVAFPVGLVNVAVADAFAEISAELKKRPHIDVVRDVIAQTKAVRFEGNNYSDEWVREASKRGLLNLKKTPESLAQLKEKSTVAVMTKLGILTEDELKARYHVRLESYIKKQLIEADTLISMLRTQILPATFMYHGLLVESVAQAKAAGIDSPQSSPAQHIAELAGDLQERMGSFETDLIRVRGLENEEEKAKALSLSIADSMLELRKIADRLEEVVGDDFWPLPKYREMLFLS